MVNNLLKFEPDYKPSSFYTDRVLQNVTKKGLCYCIYIEDKKLDDGLLNCSKIPRHYPPKNKRLWLFTYHFLLSKMNVTQHKEYANAIAGLHEWNYTTYIRTYKWITPRQALDWGKMIFNRRCVDAVFTSIERDAQKMNHLHLALATRKVDAMKLKDKIVKAVNISDDHIGNIEPIENKTQMLRYVSKSMLQSNYANQSYEYLF